MNLQGEVSIFICVANGNTAIYEKEAERVGNDIMLQKFDLINIMVYAILFLTVVLMMNRCKPSIYAGYSDFGFRNEIW